MLHNEMLQATGSEKNGTPVKAKFRFIPGKVLLAVSAAVFLFYLIISAGIIHEQFSNVYGVWQQHKHVLARLGSISLERPLLSELSATENIEMAYCPPVTKTEIPRKEEPEENSAVSKTDASSPKTATHHKDSGCCEHKCHEANLAPAQDTKASGSRNKPSRSNQKSKMSSDQKHFGVGLRFTI